MLQLCNSFFSISDSSSFLFDKINFVLAETLRLSVVWYQYGCLDRNVSFFRSETYDIAIFP